MADDHPKPGKELAVSKKETTYNGIIEKVFFDNYKSGADEVTFAREELVKAAEALGVNRPKNLGDVISSYRFRKELPQKIKEKAPKGKVWILRLAGRGKYRFAASVTDRIEPDPLLGEIKIPDATPGIIAANALSDEQALLAKVRYNRLIDIFTGVTCYSLQSHLRTTVTDMGQVETDELYVGIDRAGAQYTFPIQAKGGTTDKLSIVQIEQDYAVCEEKFPSLICHPVAAQFIGTDLVAMFLFSASSDGIVKVGESHYRLVSWEDMTEDDLAAYRSETQRTPAP